MGGNFGIEEFLPPEPEYGHPIILIDGDPKSGRTAAFLSFPMPEVVFSYDAKVRLTLGERYPNGRPWPITIADVSRIYHVTDNEWLPSAFEAHAGIIKSLQRIRSRGGVECIVHDGFHILAQIEEMRMRHIQKLKPFQTFSDWGYWKIRTMALREIVTESQRALKPEGGCLVFTTDVKLVEIKQDGQVTDVKQPPHWYDPVDSLTDIWMRTDRRDDPKAGTGKFTVTVKSSKYAAIPTHKTYDVTGKDLGTLIGHEAFKNGFQTRKPATPGVKQLDVDLVPAAAIPAEDPFAALSEPST
jgi:hypothetical protein